MHPSLKDALGVNEALLLQAPTMPSAQVPHVKALVINAPSGTAFSTDIPPANSLKHVEYPVFALNLLQADEHQNCLNHPSIHKQVVPQPPICAAPYAEPGAPKVEDIDFISCIGEGLFGEVYMARKRASND